MIELHDGDCDGDDFIKERLDAQEGPAYMALLTLAPLIFGFTAYGSTHYGPTYYGFTFYGSTTMALLTMALRAGGDGRAAGQGGERAVLGGHLAPSRAQEDAQGVPGANTYGGVPRAALTLMALPRPCPWTCHIWTCHVQWPDLDDLVPALVLTHTLTLTRPGAMV